MLTIKSLAVLFFMKTMFLTGISPRFPFSNTPVISTPSGEQPRTYTPLDEDKLHEKLFDSHIELFGYAPSHKRLAMAWAQVSLENGRGKYTWNKNLGNVIPTTSSHAFYFTDSAVKYRAFQTFNEAGMVYWATVKKCEGLLEMFDNGNASVAARMLKSCGYFEANVEDYEPALKQLYTYAVKRHSDERESCYRPIH